MNATELRLVLDAHALWVAGSGGRFADLRSADLSGADLSNAELYSADLSSANLRSADLRSANLYGANLSGAVLDWNSHQLLSEILLRAAGEDAGRRSFAGLVRISTDWCWHRYLRMTDNPALEWALDELAKWVQPDDHAPQCVTDRVKSKE